MVSSRAESVTHITEALEGEPQRVAITDARRIDASGVSDHSWLVAADGIILATGNDDQSFEAACRSASIDPVGGTVSGDAAAGSAATGTSAVIDAHGSLLTPGYIDIHAHGAWERSFDDGLDGIAIARAGHAFHGTTRQVLSLVTNPIEVMSANLRNVQTAMRNRPDILGAHLEGPFLAPSRKGAHDPQSLRNPDSDLVDDLLEASNGCIRQITIAPELPHAIEAISRFAEAGVIPAIGHCAADYATAKRGFNAGARIMTHVFNAMNGLHHREPGPIPAAVEDPRVTLEMINDGFHIQNSMVKFSFGFAPHRTAFITDAMAATDCPDGSYMLGTLAVNVVDGHARLVEGGAIAGSTLLLETAVKRAVLDLGISPLDAVEAATLTPAKIFGFDRPNAVTQAPLGLIAPGFAADLLLLDPASWTVDNVWSAGRRVR